MQNKYRMKRIFASERIFISTFSKLANFCFKIFVLNQIFPQLNIQGIIRLQIFTYCTGTSKYSLANSRIHVNIRYLLLQSIHERLSQV
jgi:hypothetical protein